MHAPDEEDCFEQAGPARVETVIVTRTRDLGGGFTVRRALPSARRRMVGPFIFLDQMGSVVFRSGQGLDVRPHPHIGLQTLTYLFDGEILHRDSLGTVQPIRPGAANWMTAGRGVVHSERTPAHLRVEGERLFGIQCWLALPGAYEEREPGFVHHRAEELPVVEGDGVRARVIAGEVFGARSPAETCSDLFYVDVAATSGARFEVPDDHEERALYVAQGDVDVADGSFVEGQLVVLRPGAEAVVTARGDARLVLLGGEPMDGPRHIWWNFVSSSRERIEQAKADWRAKRFPPVPDESERIPLPEEERPVVARYP